MATAASSTGVTSVVRPELIVHFANSVRTVLATMLGGTQATFGKPTIKAVPEISYDVSAIIGFSGEVVGSMVVSFRTDAATKLVEKFAGMPIAPGTPDFADAIGELANMFAGNAKKDLGANASISCPNVIVGPGHTIARLQDVPCVIIPVQTPLGEFAVEVCIKTVKPA